MTHFVLGITEQGKSPAFRLGLNSVLNAVRHIQDIEAEIGVK
jgi:hypothetical protein